MWLAQLQIGTVLNLFLSILRNISHVSLVEVCSQTCCSCGLTFHIFVACELLHDVDFLLHVDVRLELYCHDIYILINLDLPLSNLLVCFAYLLHLLFDTFLGVADLVKSG